jgi:hypothetical protein
MRFVSRAIFCTSALFIPAGPIRENHEVTEKFFEMAEDEFDVCETIPNEVLSTFHPNPDCKVVRFVYKGL